MSLPALKTSQREMRRQAHRKDCQKRKRDLRVEGMAEARVRVEQKEVGENLAVRKREDPGGEKHKRRGQENRARYFSRKPGERGMSVQRKMKRRDHKNPACTRGVDVAPGKMHRQKGDVKDKPGNHQRACRHQKHRREQSRVCRREHDPSRAVVPPEKRLEIRGVQNMVQRKKHEKRDSQNGVEHKPRPVLPVREKRQDRRHKSVRQNLGDFLRRALCHFLPL